MADVDDQYVPRFDPSRCLHCGLCARSCPFLAGPDADALAEALYRDIPGSSYAWQTGYYLASYAGGVRDERLRMARTSGGLATWILAELLESNIVDRVIAVRPTNDVTRLFEFAEFATAEEIRTAARSCYYPVEISQSLRAMLSSKHRYAVVALPCVIKGLRRAQAACPGLGGRIVMMVGLVCGQQRGKGFLEYLVRTAGGEMDAVERVAFRGKVPGGSARRSYTRICFRDDPMARELPPEQGFQRAWGEAFFKLPACNYCDDVYAELADVVCMDAWLPEYWSDPRGTNIVVARSALGRDLLEQGRRRGQLSLDRLEIEKVIASQRAVTAAKRLGLAAQLALTPTALPAGFTSRVRPAGWWQFASRFRKAAENRLLRYSRDAMEAQRRHGPGLKVFQRHLAARRRKDRWVLAVLNLPGTLRRAARAAGVSRGTAR